MRVGDLELRQHVTMLNFQHLLFHILAPAVNLTRLNKSIILTKSPHLHYSALHEDVISPPVSSRTDRVIRWPFSQSKLLPRVFSYYSTIHEEARFRTPFSPCPDVPARPVMLADFQHKPGRFPPLFQLHRNPHKALFMRRTPSRRSPHRRPLSR